MAVSEALADRIRHSLARKRGVGERKTFGELCFLRHGNLLVGVWKDSLIARLGPDRAGEAVLEFHVRLFDITGRPMKAWVLVEAAGVEDDAPLKGWIAQAAAFVGKLPAK